MLVRASLPVSSLAMAEEMEFSFYLVSIYLATYG